MKQTKINKLIPVFSLVLSLVFSTAIPSEQVAAKAKPSLSRKKLTLRVGKSKKLKLKNYRKKVKWSSSKKKVATVSQSGLVCAKRKGTARITAKAGKKKYVCRVTVKAKAVSQSTPVNSQSYEKAVLSLVNAEREKAGRRPLILDDDLCKAADTRAKEIVSTFSHTRPDGTSCFTAIKNMGIRYSLAAENIAAGQQTPEAVVESWMNSPGHRANILNSSFKKLGVGMVHTNDVIGCYWVQLFTGETTKSSAEPTATSRPSSTLRPSTTPQPVNTPHPVTATTQPVNPPQPTVPPVTTASPADMSTYPQDVLNLVNTERAAAGLPPLVLDSSLCAAASARAQEITTSFSHTRPDGTSCFTMLTQLNIPYNYCGENIAAGQWTPQEVMAAWMNSDGHRANILDADYGKLGVGVVKTDDIYQYYWVQMFTN